MSFDFRAFQEQHREVVASIAVDENGELCPDIKRLMNASVKCAELIPVDHQGKLTFNTRDCMQMLESGIDLQEAIQVVEEACEFHSRVNAKLREHEDLSNKAKGTNLEADVTSV